MFMFTQRCLFSCYKQYFFSFFLVLSIHIHTDIDTNTHTYAVVHTNEHVAFIHSLYSTCFYTFGAVVPFKSDIFVRKFQTFSLVWKIFFSTFPAQRHKHNTTFFSYSLSLRFFLYLPNARIPNWDKCEALYYLYKQTLYSTIYIPYTL